MRSGEEFNKLLEMVRRDSLQVNDVSAVVVRVLVTAQVRLLHLQLLSTHHGRTDGSVSSSMELPQVNLHKQQAES